MISSDFDGEKISYALVLLTFNDFKRQLYDANDWLRLNFTKEKRLLMIEGGDEYAQNNKGPPKGAWITFKS